MTIDRMITQAALIHSNDMAQNDFFAHEGSDGSQAGDRLTSAGYQWSSWGENIAAGQRTEAEVMSDWMSSSGHRANILNCEFEEIGVALVYLANDPGSVDYHYYWTEDFAKPR